MSNIIIKTGPVDEPLALAEVKGHNKISTSIDDNLMNLQIKAARQYVEKRLNIGLLTQTIEERFDSFPEYGSQNPFGLIKLSKSPLQSIVSIKYIDTDGNEDTFDAANYVVYPHYSPPRIGLKINQSWPATADQFGAVLVEYTVGYADANSIPAHIKEAMLLITAYWYFNREDRGRKIDTASDKLLNMEQVYYL